MGTTLVRTRRAVFAAMCMLILSLSAGAGGAKDAVIVGSIIGEDGTPRPGITVQAYEEGPSEQELSTTETDAKGAFRIQLSGVERCRLSFRHPDDEPSLLSRVEADGLPLYLHAGGTLDLGRLTMKWVGGKVHARTTFDGEPVAGVPLHDAPRVNRRLAMVTDEDGELRWDHQEAAGKRIVLLADDGKDLTGWFVGEVKAAGENVEADIALVRGKGSLSCHLADASGRPVARAGRLYLAPVGTEDEDTRIFPKEQFVYDLSWRSEEIGADGTCEVSEVPPGRWYVTAVIDGVTVHPNGAPGTAIEVKPNGKAAVALTLPARAGIVRGEVNFSLCGHTLAQFGAVRKETKKAPSNVGIFLIPKRADGRFFLAPFVPIAVVDVKEATRFEVKGIAEGEYLAFAGGLRRWPNPEELPDVWMLHRGTAPTFALGRVTVRSGATTNLNFVGELTAAEMARRYREPLPAVERFLAFVKGNWK